MRASGPVKRPGPLVEVEWGDVVTALGWQDPIDLDKLLTGELLPCITLGYLLAEKPDRIALCSSVNIDGYKAEVTVIPRGCIKRINRLGPVKRKIHK